MGLMTPIVYTKGKGIVPNKRVDTSRWFRAQVGTITFPIIQEMVDEIIPVSEETIIDSMRMIWED
ncbi:MAG: hypothetical protein Ct9H300mP9_0230 [Candidatus Neomarinimicrobiota bacterium]|nr:MAG: hypothetical protein Ct9H300mP9_0230 [Candidatus Neomarinimicrobiota bacterium]